MDDTTHNLGNQLLDCQQERSALRAENERLRHENARLLALNTEIERLRTTIIEMERDNKTAISNAYEAGYEAGKLEALRPGPLQ